MTQHIHVIVNPSAGQGDVILNGLYAVFARAGIRWDLSVTLEAGEGAEVARLAVERGVGIVAVYGGDGTIREVVGVLAGGDVPLAILPGGTGNLLAGLLGVPNGIRAAARLIVGRHDLKAIDVGMAVFPDGRSEPFMVAVGTGVIARVMKDADSDLKRRMGFPAYIAIALRELAALDRAKYSLQIDDRCESMEAVAVLVSNGANLRFPPVPVPRGADIRDGLVDLLVIPRIDAETALSLAGDTFGLVEGLETTPPRWQARRVQIACEPPHLITCDGDIVGHTPVDVIVRAGALRVIVPVPPAEARRSAQTGGGRRDAGRQGPRPG